MLKKSKIQKSNTRFLTVAYIICSLLGIVLHFTYEWLGGSRLAALFSAVNESTWEHTKLVFFPSFACVLAGIPFFAAKNPEYYSKSLSALIRAVLTVIFGFYIYSGILGFHVLFLDIALFFIATKVFFVYYCRAISQASAKASPAKEYGSIALLVLICVIYFIFTFAPPQIALFRDPVGGSFGI